MATSQNHSGESKSKMKTNDLCFRNPVQFDKSKYSTCLVTSPDSYSNKMLESADTPLSMSALVTVT